MVRVVETEKNKEALFLVWVLPVYTCCGPTVVACSDLVVIRYLSCVGILIAIPLSLVACMSYNNRPGAASKASLDSDPLMWEGFKLDWVVVGFHS